MLAVADSTTTPRTFPYLTPARPLPRSGLCIAPFTPSFSNLTPFDLLDSSCPRLLLTTGQFFFMHKISHNSIVLVSWALSVPAFQGLCSQDQQLLLEDAIPELLILTALQFRGSAAFHSLENQLKQFLSPTDFFKLDEVVKYIAGLNPPLNHLEVTSLKALLLFRPGLYLLSHCNSNVNFLKECNGLTDAHQVSTIQDHVQLLLFEQTAGSLSGSATPLRFGRLLLILSITGRFNRHNFLPFHASSFPHPRLSSV